MEVPEYRNVFRGTATVMGGAALGQIAILATMPIITRLYSPADFGVFSLYLSVISIASVIASLRFEYAITLVKKDDYAAYLLIVCFVLIACSSGVALLLLHALNHQPRWRVSLLGREPYILFVSFGIALVGIYQVLNYWTIRNRRYHRIAISKISQPLGTTIPQMLCGIFFPTPGALMLGDLIGRVTGISVLLGHPVAHIKNVKFRRFINTSRNLICRYRRFPMISAPSSLLNVLGLQIPSIIMLAMYGAESAGWFALVQRLLGAPLALIGQSVSQVYAGEASRLAREDIKRLPSLFWSLVKYLSLVALVPTVLVVVGGYFLIGPIFGSSWQPAGVYIVALTPMFLGQFIVVPILQTLTILERQDLQFIWDFLRAISVALAFVSAKFFEFKDLYAVATYGVLMFLMYIFGAVLTVKAMKQKCL